MQQTQSQRQGLIHGSLSAARRFSPIASPGRLTLLMVAGLAALGFLPFIKMGLVVNGIIFGSVIALGAIGLTLVYGILKLGNFAHGDYMAFGAYVAFFIVDGLLPRVGIEGAGLGPFTFGVPVIVALPLSAIVVAAGAIALDVLIYRRLRDRGASTAILTDGIPGRGHRHSWTGSDDLDRGHPALSQGIASGISPPNGSSDSS